MRHGSLFSGIGGFDLAAQWMGWENVFQVEIDPFCNNVLKKHFPQTEKYGDIKKFEGTKYHGAVDVISGGFPCQPFSLAGEQKGRSDERFLWPEMLRVIRECGPEWVVGENVYGIINSDGGMVFEDVFNSLDLQGYETLAVIIPACAVGRNHIRERTWFIAHSNKMGRSLCEECLPWRSLSRNWVDRTERDGWDAEPSLLRMDDGIPKKLDGDRIGHLGNAIVPQVAFEIFKAIQTTGKYFS